MIKRSLIVAYSKLVRASLYILDEKDREKPEQKLVPEEYSNFVAEYLVK